MKPRLCLDLDNVLARTDDVIRKVIRDYTNGRVLLEYENVVEFDYYRCVDRSGNSISRDEWREIHHLFSKPSYLWHVEPVEGIQKYLGALESVFDIHIATARLPEARRATVEWLEDHRFPRHDLHFLRHGEKHKSLGQFLASVEDSYEQAADFACTGTTSFLLEHPWNLGKPAVPGLSWSANWTDLSTSLLNLAHL